VNGRPPRANAQVRIHAGQSPLQAATDFAAERGVTSDVSWRIGESKRLVVESPWSQLTSERRRL
jgi:hypothetical protein